MPAAMVIAHEQEHALARGYADMIGNFRPEHPYLVFNGFTAHQAGNMQWTYPSGTYIPGPQDYAKGWEIRSFATAADVQTWLHGGQRLRRLCRFCFPLGELHG